MAHKCINIILLFTLALGYSTYAQSESKSKKIATSSEDARAIFNDAPDEAFSIIEADILDKVAKKDKIGEAKAYLVLGDYYNTWEQPDLALTSHKKALGIAESTRNATLRRNAQKKVAASANTAGDYILSEKLYKQLIIGSTSTSELVALYEALANVQLRVTDNNSALENIDKAIALAEDVNNAETMARLLGLRGNALAALGKDSEALNSYKGSEEQSLNAPNTVVQYQSRANIADYYNKRGEYDKEISTRNVALEELNEADLDEAEEITKEDNPAVTQNLAIADAYIEQKNYNNAIPYFKKSEEASRKTGDVEQQLKAVKGLSNVYEKVGKADLALSNYKRYVELVDATYETKEEEIEQAVDLNNQLNDKQSRIDFLEKDQQLRDSQSTISKNTRSIELAKEQRLKIIIFSLLLGLALLGITAFSMWRSNRQKSKANQVLALKQLRSQMNPHFIFNALNSVNMFIAQNNERAANKFLADFSKLMRSVLDYSEKDFITLNEELELLEKYVALEHLRFPEKFNYTITVDDSINKKAFSVPPMLLQPYVENAIWHGLRYKEGSNGHLSIVVNQVTENKLRVVIEDNGIGREKSKQLKTENQKKATSKGMRNTAERVKLLNKLHDNDITIGIDNVLENGEGTRVTLNIPAKNIANAT